MSSIELVFQGHNTLRYKVTLTASDDAVVPAVLFSTGAASPDLQTDTLAGPLWNIARAGVNGIGTVPPGALTAAQARDILLADDSGASVGNSDARRARCQLTGRDVGEWTVDASVDGSHNPALTISGSAAGVVYLDIEFLLGIGA